MIMNSEKRNVRDEIIGMRIVVKQQNNKKEE